MLDLGDGQVMTPGEVSTAHPLPFPLRSTVTIRTGAPELPRTTHKIEIAFEAKPFGKLKLKVEDAITDEVREPYRIPRAEGDDYAPEIIRKRQALAEEVSGIKLRHLTHYSFDPHMVKGNCEHFAGVAQVPIGLAGPIRIHGEHADGEFLIPLATSEGTLVASYNRGIKVLNLAGGVHATVLADAMQRAPVFVFANARGSRNFLDWIQANLDDIRRQAEATSSIARLQHIDPYVPAVRLPAV